MAKETEYKWKWHINLFACRSYKVNQDHPFLDNYWTSAVLMQTETSYQSWMIEYEANETITMVQNIKINTRTQLLHTSGISHITRVYPPALLALNQDRGRYKASGTMHCNYHSQSNPHNCQFQFQCINTHLQPYIAFLEMKVDMSCSPL